MYMYDSYVYIYYKISNEVVYFTVSATLVLLLVVVVSAAMRWVLAGWLAGLDCWTAGHSTVKSSIKIRGEHLIYGKHLNINLCPLRKQEHLLY